MTTRKNTDYTRSAVNLTNPPEIGKCLATLHKLRDDLDNTLADIETVIPERLKNKRDSLEKAIPDLTAEISGLINTLGSYQDVERGWYAVKQVKKSIVYDAALTRQTIGDQLADVVIYQAVDKAKVEQLIKGGLVSPEDAERCGRVSISYQYIIH